MNGISTAWGNESFYLGKNRTVSYENDGAFSSLISEAQTSPESGENKYDFSDMYVRTHQHSIEEDKKDLYAAWRPWSNRKYMWVPVAGDLVELMESIEKGLADGKPLRIFTRSQ
ncbi:MAG: hypothetical protein HDT43_11180 [Ruminococcaceae bacterium]|nr:hypothetical protein [Oscillospiraceae bacterium]